MLLGFLFSFDGLLLGFGFCLGLDDGLFDSCLFALFGWWCLLNNDISMFVDHSLVSRLRYDYRVTLGVEIALVAILILVHDLHAMFVDGVFVAILGDDGDIAVAVADSFVSVFVAGDQFLFAGFLWLDGLGDDPGVDTLASDPFVIFFGGDVMVGERFFVRLVD